MTRKDYQEIAEALARTRPNRYPEDGPGTITADTQPYWYQWSVTRDAIMGALQLDNPNFDRPRFIRATEDN